MNSYYTKYIKYKNKYLELKHLNQNGGNSYIETLKKRYPNCVHDNIKLENADKYLKDGYATTYGEMDYEAIEIFNRLLNSQNKFNVFIDFGSGRGKIPLFMAIYFDKSIGIELVKERHEDALKLKQELSIDFSNFTNKVELLNIDMFEYLKTINKNTFTNPVLIWISNLCFSDLVTTRLFEELVERLPSQSILGCSKIPNIIPVGIQPLILNGYSQNKIDIPMSWNKNSSIYIYIIT